MYKSLFVGNIAYGALEAEINELFSQYGEVDNVHFCMDWQRGKFRGFGFVSMKADAIQKTIDSLDGYEFQERKLKVSLAQSKSQADKEEEQKSSIG